MLYRTHHCGELCKKDIGKTVILSGWIQKIRNLGSLIFIDLRDYFGIIQLFCLKKIINTIPELGREFLIKINGKVIERKSKNYHIPTGEIEILVCHLEILNTSIIPPFIIEDKTDGNEELRMKYKYLDIRRSYIKKNLILRHNISLEIRNFLSKNGFLEIETPLLINHSPEGAKSFFVPSRIHTKKFYALSQSPQLFKQLLMIGGIHKYFQIVKCFRDEDARSDRQIEFTQIDCEMSFVQVKDILIFFENFIKYLFKKIKNIQLESFQCMTYYDVMKIYGTDTPDLRIEMKLIEMNNFLKKKGMNFLNKEQLKTIGINIPNCCHYTNNEIKSIIKNIPSNQINNFFWIKYFPNKKFFSSKKEFCNNENFLTIIKYFKAKPGDLLFFICSEKKIIKNILHKIRIEMYHRLNLKNSNIFKSLWIIDLPLLKWNEKEKKYKSSHHPFTSPKKEDLHFLKKKKLENIRSQSYELIINGVEIGSGSIRIHDKKIQNLIFKYLGLSVQEIQSKFGFFIESLNYGTPPHGGIAFGLDRLIAILEGKNNIKDFIAFPKNNLGKDIMINSPSLLEDKILKELHLYNK